MQERNSPSLVSPYAKQMGDRIVALIHLFDGKMPDQQMHSRLISVASESSNWGDAHDVRSSVRTKLLATKDSLIQSQCYLTESCLETIYNETNPDDPFDSVAPFWVVPSALGLARELGINVDLVIAAASGGG